jgi:hypothetical protein
VLLLDSVDRTDDDLLVVVVVTVLGIGSLFMRWEAAKTRAFFLDMFFTMALLLHSRLLNFDIAIACAIVMDGCSISKAAASATRGSPSRPMLALVYWLIVNCELILKVLDGVFGSLMIM